MFKKDFILATVSRLGYTTAGGYSKSEYTPTGVTYFGNLKASSINFGVDVGAFGKDYQFNCDISADIREGDRLTIDGVNYDVKGVADFRGVTFSRKMITLSKNKG